MAEPLVKPTEWIVIRAATTSKVVKADTSR